MHSSDLVVAVRLFEVNILSYPFFLYHSHRQNLVCRKVRQGYVSHDIELSNYSICPHVDSPAEQESMLYMSIPLDEGVQEVQYISEMSRVRYLALMILLELSQHWSKERGASKTT